MSLEIFRYTPLSKPDAFRILHVQPSPDQSAEIKCTLEHTTLSKYDYDILSPYTALSYVWGDASDQRTILVDEQPFIITKNLHDALTCLRDDKRILSIWADAICINQFNVPERNHQVSQMGRIYSSATYTIIFLDSSSEDFDYALLGTLKIVDEEIFLSDSYTERVGKLLLAFARVTSRPWFSRAWVLQELSLSRDPIMQCGRSRIRWHDFFTIGFALSYAHAILTAFRNEEEREAAPANLREYELELMKHQAPNDGSKDVFQILIQIWLTRKNCHLDFFEMQEHKGNKLSDLVEGRRGCGATDPRDVVYAQIGLVSSSHQSTSAVFDIDYNKSVARVYSETAYNMLMEGLNVFEWLESKNSNHNPLGLSSWVPDWSRPLYPPRHRKTPFLYPQQLNMRLTTLPDEKYILLLHVNIVAEIIQIGSSTKTAFEKLSEADEQSFDEHSSFSLDPESVMRVMACSHGFSKPFHQETEKGDYPIVEQGFQRILQTWASTVGLTDRALLPWDDVSDMLSSPSVKNQAQNLGDKPFHLMNSFYRGIHTAPDADFDNTSVGSRTLEGERFCTIESKYPVPGRQTPYQIKTVHEASQVGDIIVLVSRSYAVDVSRALVLRRVQLHRKDAENLPPVYQVIGTFWLQGFINLETRFDDVSDRIALI